MKKLSLLAAAAFIAASVAVTSIPSPREASVFTGRVSPEDGANELQSEYEDVLAKQ